jgi:hypothetical protein
MQYECLQSSEGPLNQHRLSEWRLQCMYIQKDHFSYSEFECCPTVYHDDVQKTYSEILQNLKIWQEKNFQWYAKLFLNSQYFNEISPAGCVALSLSHSLIFVWILNYVSIFTISLGKIFVDFVFRENPNRLGHGGCRISAFRAANPLVGPT